MIGILKSDSPSSQKRKPIPGRSRRVLLTRVGSARAAARRRALAAVGSFLDCPHRKRISSRQVAQALDDADRLTQEFGWKELFLGSSSRSEVMEALAHSSSEVGWKRLGLPPCLQSSIGPSTSGSIEHPESWTQLLSQSLELRLRPGSEDPRVDEYRRLYQAHQELQKGTLQGRVSETALYLDLKELESELLPDHLRKAQERVKSRLLGSGSKDSLHPSSRVRRFLGAVSAAPPSAREQRFYNELSSIALKRPKELSFFAGRLLEEIRRCPSRLGPKLQADFRKALARVARTHSKTLTGTKAEDCGRDFESLLQALKGPKKMDAGPEQDKIEYYRSGLTLNGYVRNYTYL